MLAALLIGVAAVTGLGADGDPSWAGLRVPERPTLGATAMGRGESLYETHCAVCHGASGGGDGRCADGLEPRPRDLSAGFFRFKTTRQADPPTEEDLYRTITVGLFGTSMPPFRQLLDEAERWLLVTHLKTLSAVFEAVTTVEPVALGRPPAEMSQRTLARGGRLYRDLKCDQCHGERGSRRWAVVRHPGGLAWSTDVAAELDHGGGVQARPLTGRRGVGGRSGRTGNTDAGL